ncbi:hypothetical protein K488DRAFT_48378 [Vararia minispora EC-137]|uniref:Uncharacterized protein n=1 Tax=Vararia minispora EC-137 TaxID=1314806 RepID=A0ACB8QMP9_9AGAM|nr:hypothetical protein K488DRAFT_48378 [Vararia minispora EC-137]
MPPAPAGPRPPAPAPPREKRPWRPPTPPGPTLRQRVEAAERARGWRCDDVSCGAGPSDEEPVPARELARVGVRPLPGVGGERVCAHAFHLPCLVQAERVAGWGSSEQEGEQEQEQEERDGMIVVACPVCRAVGGIERAEWEEGVRLLDAE